MPPIPIDSSEDPRGRFRCPARSGSTLRPMGPNLVCYSYHATLIPNCSCLKPVDTFRRGSRGI